MKEIGKILKMSRYFSFKWKRPWIRIKDPEFGSQIWIPIKIKPWIRNCIKPYVEPKHCKKLTQNVYQ